MSCKEDDDEVEEDDIDKVRQFGGQNISIIALFIMKYFAVFDERQEKLNMKERQSIVNKIIYPMKKIEVLNF